MSQDKELELALRRLRLESVLLTTAKKLHPHAMILYYILLAKTEKCLFMLGVHLHIPVSLSFSAMVTGATIQFG